MANAVPFIFYYVQFRVAVMLGMYLTTNPVDILWRWRHWEYIRQRRRAFYCSLPVKYRRHL